MRCPGCQGIVRNVPSKRHPLERLMEIHRASCPAGRTGAAR